MAAVEAFKRLYNWLLKSDNNKQHPFNSLLFGTTQVRWYQVGKTNLDLLKQESEWQWHQLDHMQVCTSFQTQNHGQHTTSQFFYRLDALPARKEQCQGIESTA